MRTNLSIKDRPKNVNLNQFLLEISLDLETLKNKYHLDFEKTQDDMSEVEVCLIFDGGENYFLILARPIFPEVKISVFSSPKEEGDIEALSRLVDVFVSVLNFDILDISSRIDEGY